MESNTNKCLHCQLKLLSNQEEFCCSGCKLAYNIINSLNLNDYYDFCKKIYNSKPMKIEEIQNEINYSDIVYYNEEKKQYEIHLLVEGIQCGSCVWLIENTLSSYEGVVSSKINLSTERLFLVWKGEAEDINKYVKLISEIGYKLIPFDSALLESESSQKEIFLLKCIAVSGFAVIQLMMIVMGVWFSDTKHAIGPHTKDLLHFIAMLIAIPSILYSGLPFFKSAYEALKNKRSNMDVPITIGIFVTTLISVWEFVRGGGYTYFDSAIMLIFALLIGRFLDIKYRNKAKSKAKELILRQARSVTLISGDKLKLLPINKVNIGDIVYISAGEKVPVDGVIIDGETEIDNSIITGETTPVEVQKGSNVFSGSINLLSPIKVEIKKLGDDTVLGEIIRLIENAEQAKAKYVEIADKVASFYTPVVLTLSMLTFIGWAALGAEIYNALFYAVSVLIITCPCALGLAVPVAQIIASSSLMKRGILLKSSSALERISQVNTVVFDKTGTLTYGTLELIQDNEITENDMRIIASMAASSVHPLCKAISRNYNSKLLPIQVKETKGMGLKATYKNKTYRLGNKSWCGIEYDLEDNDLYTEVWFRQDNKTPVRLKFSDIIRDEAKAVVRKLKDKGYKVYILSGDRKYAVDHTASYLEIENYHAEMKPDEKYHFLEKLDKEGELALMVGDGLNDSAALKKAHASISPSSAADITQNSADIIFQNDLSAVNLAIDIATKSDSIVKQNFIISLVYNVISIPFAVFGFVTPLIAAITMASSSICVIANSLRLSKITKKY